MNPTLSIVVNNSRKATATGAVAVGELVDVSITCPNVTLNDKLRLRITDELGRDLVRYPLASTDVWTYSNNVFTATVNFNTAQLRAAFGGIPFNEKVEFGVIIDSDNDKAQYGTGKVKLLQWSMASTEDPTVLPDWRVILADLQQDLNAVVANKTAAQNAANAANASSIAAAASAASALDDATTAGTKATQAATSASGAHDDRVLAQAAKASAEAAKLAAEVAVTHYPQIGANGNWFVWNVASGAYADTGYAANGGHNIFKGVTFARPTTAKGWYDLVAYLIREMGGNINVSGVTPGTPPSMLTMTADDGTSRNLKIVKSAGEYTTEVV